MKNTRCEEVSVQLIIRTYDAMGRPIRQVVAPPQQPILVFRNAETLDFWGYVDRQVKLIEAAQAQQAQPPAPPEPKPLKLAKGRK